MWLGFAVSDAWACKVVCESARAPGRLVQPADGATDVPVDAQPVVASTGTVRLIGPDGEALATSVRPPGGTALRLVRFTVDEALVPGVAYRVEEEVDGAVRPVGSFTTGDGALDAAAPPPPPSLSADGWVDLDLRPGHGLGASCGGAGEGVAISITWPETTGMYELRATRPDGSAAIHEVAGSTFRLGWEVPCLATAPGLTPREVVQVEVRSVDLRGRLGPWSAPLVTSVRTTP